MPEVQHAPLAPEVAYVLDEALENWDVNAHCHLVLNLLGDRAVIDRITSVPRGRPRSWLRGGRGEMFLELDAYAHEVAAGMPGEDRRAFFAASLLRETGRLTSLAGCYAGWNYEDSLVGGCMEEQHEPRMRADGSPRRRLARRLYSPAAIRRYVRLLDCDSAEHAAELARRMRVLPWPDHPGEADRLDDFFRVADARRAEARRRAMQSMLLRAQGGRDYYAARRRYRRQLARSAGLACRVVGRDAVRDLMEGRAVVLPAAGLRVAVTQGTFRSGHGGVRVRLRDAEDTDLAGLCLYFEMPALDQLAALALHVGEGNLAHLLEVGNLYDVTAAGAAHPVVVDVIRESARRALEGAATAPDAGPAEQIIWGCGVRGRGPWYDRAALDRARDEYERATGGYYLEAVLHRVWGTDGRRVRRFARQVVESREDRACSPAEHVLAG